MNIEEIVNIFVESVFLRIPYEEMKKKKLEEKEGIKQENPEKTNKDNKINENPNKNNKKIVKKEKETKNNKKKGNKNKKLENDIYTPIKTMTNYDNKSGNKKEFNNNTSTNNSNKIPRTTKSDEKRKKKIKIKNELTENKPEVVRRIKYNIFSEEKPKKSKKGIKNKNKNDPSLKLTKDLMKKQQEEIDFNRKFDYLKKRIEALKVQEEKIRLEKIYNQKKEIKLGKNLANKKKEKKLLEEFKKKENDQMKNRKESAKKIYEEENKLLKTFGSQLSLKNREYFLQLKKEKEKLRKERMRQDEELMIQRKNKMLSNKNKSRIKEYNENPEIKNNQKMNYIYSAKSIEYLKQNIYNLEKLEKEYIKKIQEEKKGIFEVPKRRNMSATKSRNRYKLNKDKEKDKNININKEEKQEKDYSIEIKEDMINNNNIDIDSIKLDKKIDYKYKDDSLKSETSQEKIKEIEIEKDENILKEEKKESNPGLITLDKIIVENK